MGHHRIQRDITRTVLAVFFIVALMGSAIWILRPFLGAVVRAATIVVATWPFMRVVEAWLWGKRWLAVAAMTFLLLAVLVAPLSLAIGAIVANVDEIAEWARSLSHFTMAPTPEWLRGLPLIGGAAVEAWRYAAAAGIQDIAAKAAPYAGVVIKWFVAQLGNIGVLFVQFLLTVVLAAAMYANGEYASERIVRFGRHLAGSGGENAVFLAGQTIRGVALGIVGTALAQSLFSRHRPFTRRRSIRSSSYRSDLYSLYRPARAAARARAGSALALLGRQHALGNILASLWRRCGDNGLSFCARSLSSAARICRCFSFLPA